MIGIRKHSQTYAAIALLLLLASVPAAAATFGISSASWSSRDSTLSVRGSGTPGRTVTVYNAVTGTAVGSTRVSRSETWALSARLSSRSVPCRVRATSDSSSSELAVSGAPSNCVGVTRSLSSLSITGPASVPEGTQATYSATATYSDGSTQNVTSAASWTENSSYATISAGVLQAGQVSSNQQVTISAGFTAGGVSRSATATVTIVNGGSTQTASHAGRFTSFDGTATCIQCHRQQATDMHASAHYQWKGSSIDVLNNPDTPSGKLGSINDFCIYPDINWLGKLTTVDGQTVDGGCARCHAGLGLRPDPLVSETQLQNIDCLLCHSPSYKRTLAQQTDGTFRFVPDLAKMTVPLMQAATDLRKPGKDACLNCHASSGGGNNFKRGDIEDILRDPPRSLDVHMASTANGGAGLTCVNCHLTQNHRIAGRGSDLRPRDSSATVACTNCHSTSPHDSSQLNRHTARVDCSVCHIPAFARNAPTDMLRDWSLPGEVDAVKRLYDPAMVKMMNVVPEYRFFNGKSWFCDFGTPATPGSSGRILMSGPDGKITDPGARIRAFKRHYGNQPQDPVTLRLLPLKIGIFFQTGNLSAAVQEGVRAVGWTYNGHQFAGTERLMAVSHSVAPHEQALTCNQCHGSGTRMDWAGLGYTPNTTRNGRPLCASCHEDESGEWSASELFTKVHDKHVTDKKLDCINCHGFQAAR